MAILLKEIGSFYIGGHQITISGKPVYKRQFVKGGPIREVDPNGDFETGQMYVQYFKLKTPHQKYPVLLMHGGGVCGSIWEESLTENESWLQLFLKHGFNTYVVDAMERGRSGFSQYPDIYTSEPIFRSKNEAWTNFRIGSIYNSDPLKRIAFSDTQFPAERFDDFMKMNVPRWTTNNTAITNAYSALLQKMEDCILIIHSQASEFAGILLNKFSHKIKAAVIIEGSSAPSDENLCCTIPTLYIWGSHIEEGSNWEIYRANMRHYYEKQLSYNAPVTWLNLPETGINGNSHFMMIDKNSTDIFNIIYEWLQKIN